MRKIMFAILLLWAARVALAQEARLSGTWALDLSKSFLAGEHPISGYELVWTIEQSGSQITLAEKSHNASFANILVPDAEKHAEFTTDGKEYEVQKADSISRANPTSAVVKAEWQGNTLLVTERGASWGGSSITRRRIFASPDGSQITVLLEMHSQMLDMEESLVFQRVGAR
jgi:hypothetical protein